MAFGCCFFQGIVGSTTALRLGQQQGVGGWETDPNFKQRAVGCPVRKPQAQTAGPAQQFLRNSRTFCLPFSSNSHSGTPKSCLSRQHHKTAWLSWRHLLAPLPSRASQRRSARHRASRPDSVWKQGQRVAAATGRRHNNDPSAALTASFCPLPAFLVSGALKKPEMLTAPNSRPRRDGERTSSATRILADRLMDGLLDSTMLAAAGFPVSARVTIWPKPAHDHIRHRISAQYARWPPWHLGCAPKTSLSILPQLAPMTTPSGTGRLAGLTATATECRDSCRLSLLGHERLAPEKQTWSPPSAANSTHTHHTPHINYLCGRHKHLSNAKTCRTASHNHVFVCRRARGERVVGRQAPEHDTNSQTLLPPMPLTVQVLIAAKLQMPSWTPLGRPWQLAAPGF